MPYPVAGIDLNFCRNPACAEYGILPDPFKRPNGSEPAPPGVPRGAVSGKKHEEYYQCDSCGTTHRLKNNRAVAEEVERLRRIRSTDPSAPACRNTDCANHGLSVAAHPGMYQRFGKTKGGDARWRCKGCGKTFSVGKPARRHKRSDKNRLVLDMLCNDLSFAKMSRISGLAYRDIYRRVDFYFERVQGFVARREDFGRIDFRDAGSRFATDSQALTINWPSRKRRFPVVFQHLCTAHARSGFIMEASFQLDPAVSPKEAEAQAAAAAEDHISTAYRDHARIWTKSEFDAHLVRLAKAAGLAEVEEYGLPATGSMLRYDIMQIAHALRLREHIGEGEVPLIFVMDGDAGLKLAFQAVFQPEISAGRAHLAVIDFDKAMTNDKRNSVVAEGREDLCRSTGLSPAELNLIPSEFYAKIVDAEIATRLAGTPIGGWFSDPFSTKSEPNKRVLLLTRRAEAVWKLPA
ncbi:hypothetical protein ORIO_00255 [Cereibacter azotoformans]|nr:hypothetical protein [Cereibacter azotoformans]ULB08374.1 hypothetical protein ORIO_00255 [Cereibacter azotoformans]